MSGSEKPSNRKRAISPTRAENYPEWYQQVIKAADLAENSPVRGCMVIKPYGYAIWENIQRELDRMFKETGHVNAYFPLLIPMSFLEKEAEHIQGFAKECAVVTHHRLEADGTGKLKPAGKLEEPFVIRPTSETIIGDAYSRWVQSWRDLPVLVNQWCNVMRWELRTRMFLRTSEFLWQEGHTVHATKDEAWEETIQMLEVYRKFANDFLAMPVITGRKTPDERFPGAVETYTLEAMMQDRKALQACTSHFLGQNFSKAFNIQFLDQKGDRQFGWTTSWGATTRLIGGMIMMHSDDDGAIMPPRVAPYHVVIMPVLRKEEERAATLAYCQRVKKKLQEQVYSGQVLRVHLDDRDISGGDKGWEYVKKGVPIRIEIGPREVAANTVFCMRRDTGEKQSMPNEQFVLSVRSILDEIQGRLYAKAEENLKANIRRIDSLKELEAFFKPSTADEETEIFGGIALAHWNEKAIGHPIFKQLKISPRCIPLPHEEWEVGVKEEGKCIFTGEKSSMRVVFARSY